MSILAAVAVPFAPSGTVLTASRVFHAAVVPGSSFSELMPGLWVSRSFQNSLAMLKDICLRDA